MFTRQQYLNKECSFEQYYLEIAAESGFQPPSQLVKLCEKSQDPNFNDIPLIRFDIFAKSCSSAVDKAFRVRGDYPTIAGMVCLIKVTIRRQLS